ncbi:MAG: Crp/Fnr family transcriptional regulator [Balneola sp.]|nr:MAG: Crp/Fnr family transcriptional regulator [Balneola sp.]
MNISEEVYQILQENSRKKELGKNKLLFQPPSSARKILFLETGLMRGYKIADGKDYTHHFFTPNWFATDFESFLTSSPGSLFIESLTPVSYLEIDKEVLYRLYEEHHQLEKLGREIAEIAYLITVEKVSDLQMLNLKERYKSLIRKNPQLFINVPQKYIASYLGVSEQSLSRIKGK